MANTRRFLSLHAAAASLAAVVLLYAASDPGDFVGFAAGAFLLCWSGLYARLLQMSITQRAWTSWLLCYPLLITIVIASLAASWPLRIRFAASRLAFENALKWVQDQSAPRLTGPVGGWTVHTVEKERDGAVSFSVAFMTAIIYTPADTPPRPDSVRLAQGWYYWCDD